MIKTIYLRAAKVLAKKPFVLWGISLLHGLLSVVVSVLVGIIPGLALAFTWLLSTSMTMIFLYGYRGEEVKSTQLFECFKDWATIKRVLCGMGWMHLWIFLWSLIPVAGIVFGIIRSYEYRLTPYILVTEKDVAITDAIKVSKARTKGFKGKMFGADILVYVLIFAVSLVLGLLSAIPFIGVLFAIVSFVFTVAVALFVGLFLGLVQAAFYEEINTSHHCPQCGEVVESTSSFCSKCGAAIK